MEYVFAHVLFFQIFDLKSDKISILKSLLSISYDFYLY